MRRDVDRQCARPRPGQSVNSGSRITRTTSHEPRGTFRVPATLRRYSPAIRPTDPKAKRPISTWPGSSSRTRSTSSSAGRTCSTPSAPHANPKVQRPISHAPIFVDIRPGPQVSQAGHLQPHLLADLPGQRLLGGLARVHEPAGQIPESLAGLLAPHEHNHPPAPVHDHAGHRRRGVHVEFEPASLAPKQLGPDDAHRRRRALRAIPKHASRPRIKWRNRHPKIPSPNVQRDPPVLLHLLPAPAPQ